MPLPVWFLDTGISEASAVLVWVRPIPIPGAAGPPPAPEHRLLTAQHVLRTIGNTDGPYSSNLQAWPPGVSYHGSLPFALEVDRTLTPSDTTPLQDAEDFAFLKLKTATGANAAPLLADAACKDGLNGLDICGYSTGSALLENHQGETIPVPYPNWRLLQYQFAHARGILSPGSGSPQRGTSGGGVFLEDRYAGVYRGAFGPEGEHCFLPIPNLRIWLQARGYEFVDLSVTGQVDVIVKQLVSVVQHKSDPGVSPLLANAQEDLRTLSNILLEFRTQKHLHDHLHKIQLQYSSAAWAARAGLEDEEKLNTYEQAVTGMDMALKETSKSINEIPQDAGDNIRLEKTRAQHWYKNLRDALDTAATSGENSASAIKACDTIGTTLRRQMSLINGKLIENADNMDLKMLGNLLKQIGNTLPAPEREELLIGSDACGTVQVALKDGVDLHNRWQKLDNTLWDAELGLAGAAIDAYENFLLQWQILLTSLRGLTAIAPGAGWATRVALVVAAGQTIINTVGRPRLTSNFQRVARECRNQFLNVDDQLLSQADRVAGLRKPLQNLL